MTKKRFGVGAAAGIASLAMCMLWAVAPVGVDSTSDGEVGVAQKGLKIIEVGDLLFKGIGQSDLDYERMSCSGSDRQRVNAIIGNYMQARRNVFFEESTFVGDLLAEEGNIVAALRGRLGELPDIAALSPEAAWMRIPPEALLQRMGALDLLGSIQGYGSFKARHEARSALREAVTNPPLAVDDATLRIVGAEQYDALAILARDDAWGAIDFLSQLDSLDLQQALLPAVGVGLIDAGFSRADVRDILSNLKEEWVEETM